MPARDRDAGETQPAGPAVSCVADLNCSRDRPATLWRRTARDQWGIDHGRSIPVNHRLREMSVPRGGDIVTNRNGQFSRRARPMIGAPGIGREARRSNQAKRHCQRSTQGKTTGQLVLENSHDVSSQTRANKIGNRPSTL